MAGLFRIHPLALFVTDSGRLLLHAVGLHAHETKAADGLR